jgi:hypothetical protein
MARDWYLDPEVGPFHYPTRWNTLNVPAHFRRLTQYLGDDFDLRQLRHDDYRRIWRKLIAEYVHHPKQKGHRTAEMVLGTLRTLMRWLAEKEYVDHGTGEPDPKWQDQLAADWEHATQARVPTPTAGIRYEPGEVANILQALPDADPRIRIAIHVAGRHRVGQFAARTTRKDILSHDGREIGRKEILDGSKRIGAVRIHGSGKKRGAIVELSADQTDALTHELQHGWLSNLEYAYSLRKIPNYRLLPGGYSAGKPPRAQVRNAEMSIGDRALRGYWLALENLAKVEHKEGRGWLAFSRSVAASAGQDDPDEILTYETILPRPVYENTRGFIEKLAKQINAAYQHKIFDGSAVLMRRLTEVLLILSYEHAKIESAIQDAADNYLPLERIIANAKANRALKLSRNSKDFLDEFRRLGNFAAHKIYFTTHPMDIRNVAQEYRALIEELLHKAGLRK